MILFSLGIGVVFLIGLVIYLAKNQGRSEMRADKEEEINHAALKAVLIRNRLDSDPDFARRVRENFTRKLLPDLPARLHKPSGHEKDARANRPE